MSRNNTRSNIKLFLSSLFGLGESNAEQNRINEEVKRVESQESGRREKLEKNISDHNIISNKESLKGREKTLIEPQIHQLNGNVNIEEKHEEKEL